MGKLKKFLYFFITFIFLSCPIKAKASSLTLTPEALNLLNNGIDLLSYGGSVPYGFLPFVFSSDKDYQSVIENYLSKQDVFVVNGSPNINIRPLNDSEYGLLENAYVYDDDGNIVSLSDLYYGTVDNGYFTEKFYCKNDGTIVYQDLSKENPYIDVKFGGSELSYIQWQNIYDEIGQSIENNGYHYNLNGDSVGNVSYYLAVGMTEGGSPTYAASLFIGNQYQPDVIVPASTGAIASWYTNNPELLQYSELYGNVPSVYGLNIQSGNYSYNGHNYNYLCTFWGNNQYLTWAPNNTLENWVNGINPYYTLFSNLGYIYNANLMNDDTVSYQKVQADTDTIDFTNSYSYGALSDYISTLDDVQTYPNSGYSQTDTITALNYPYVFTIDEAVSDVVIPFPDTVVIDDTPVIEYPLTEDIDPTLITNNIPIISGLENKFPFSIPWDIYKLINGLSVPRETPIIEHTIEFPIINYEWEIEIDLSMYDDTAELFRTLFLILFIIGLAVFSYNHFFGT